MRWFRRYLSTGSKPLILANANYFGENFTKAFRQELRPIHLVIIDLQSTPITDVTAVSRRVMGYRELTVIVGHG
jgi:hypothetical protein